MGVLGELRHVCSGLGGAEVLVEETGILMPILTSLLSQSGSLLLGVHWRNSQVRS
jgi:hypothetical protein